MKQTEVPQDNTDILNGVRKALYAFDDNGECVITPSSGWSVEEMATMQAVEEFKRLEKEAYLGFLNKDVSPLTVWMYRCRMSIPTLASCMGYWQWKVKSHMKYNNFKKLKPKVLELYSQTLNISLEQLLNPKECI
ncbi:MAG: hypothetical protein PHI79_02830 [Sulfurovaceae bacterium]|nr:hypothetical protein [Sulfurovaceae bacterium]MDD5548514.1 hypothetical protein [Sulfurovaceae bacterium]